MRQSLRVASMALALAAVSSACTVAAPNVTVLARPPASDEDLPPVRREVLPNGMRLILQEVILEEARIEADNPRTAIIRQLHGLVFGDHPYGRPVLGTPATMNAATRESLVAFNRRYYSPENMSLVVVGPVDAAAVRRRPPPRWRLPLRPRSRRRGTY